MELIPAVCQPVLPEAVDPSPAASPAAPASSKKHERELAEVLCAFCHEGEDSDDPDEDPIIPIETGRAKQHYAHENCIWWCPDVWQDKDLKWQNAGKALSRCHRLKCAVCGEGDAPLGCKRAACRKNWHYPCAMEPTTGLVILEDEFCVACVVCNELLIRRARKKQLALDLKKAQKAAAKPSKAASKSPAARGWNATVSPATGGGTPGAASSKTVARAPTSAKGGGKAPKGGGMAPPPVPPKSDKTSAAAQAAARAVWLQAEAQAAAGRAAPSAPPLPPPPPPPPPAPPPPPPNPRFEAAAKAMNALFSKQRTEDLPLETVRAAVELSDDELDELLEQLDQDNKVMCRSGTVYLI